MQNFDEVLVPADHVSRDPNDTYYIDTETVLRCHTSAHQAETLRKGERAFLVTGASRNEAASCAVISAQLMVDEQGMLSHVVLHVIHQRAVISVQAMSTGEIQ